MSKTYRTIAAAIIACSLASVTFAAEQPATVAMQPLQPAAKMMLIAPKMTLIQPATHKQLRKLMKRHRHNFSHSWRRALHRTKQLSPMQAKIVAEAAVILYGDSNTQVGQITAVPGPYGMTNYKVQVTDKQGRILDTLLMNGGNGVLLKKSKGI